MTVDPDTTTFESVAAIVSNAELSDVFLIVMFLPDTATTASSKVNTTSAFVPTPVSSSAGDVETRFGATTSAKTVKFSVVESATPAKAFDAVSTNEPASTRT